MTATAIPSVNAPAQRASIPISTAPALVKFIESAATPGIFYRTTPTFCPCKSFRFSSEHDPDFKCKHQLRAWPARCANCGTEPVERAGYTCVGCCNLITIAGQNDAILARPDGRGSLHDRYGPPPRLDHLPLRLVPARAEYEHLPMRMGR